MTQLCERGSQIKTTTVQPYLCHISALARRSCSHAVAGVGAARSDTEGALDNPSLAANAALEGEHLGLALE